MFLYSPRPFKLSTGQYRSPQPLSKEKHLPSIRYSREKRIHKYFIPRNRALISKNEMTCRKMRALQMYLQLELDWVRYILRIYSASFTNAYAMQIRVDMPLPKRSCDDWRSRHCDRRRRRGAKDGESGDREMKMASRARCRCDPVSPYS